MRALRLRQFLFRLVFLATLPGLAVVMYISARHALSVRTFYESNAGDWVTNVAVTVDRRLESILAGLNTLAASPLIDDKARWSEFYATAQGFRENYGIHVILASVDSDMLLNTRSPYGSALPKLPVPAGHAAVPAVLRSGSPSVGDTFWGPIAGEKLVAVVVPVSRAGSIRYVLLGLVEIRQFQGMMESLAIPETWTLSLLDGKGDIIADRQATARPPSRKGTADKATARYRRFDVALGNAYWTLSLDVSESEFRKQAVVDLAGWSLVLGVALFSSLMLGTLAGGQLTKASNSLLLDSPNAAIQTPIVEFNELRSRLKLLNDEREQALSTLKLFVEHAPAAIAMFDRNMRYLAVSARFLKDYRLDAPAVIGRSHYEVFPDLPDRWKEIHTVCLGGAVRKNEKDPFPRADGSVDWVRWEITPWYGNGGSVGGLLLFSEVITDWVAAEDTIRSALAEKEILIQELMHRTNNNMQVIESLLYTYAQTYPDMPAGEFSMVITNKIQALALVYNQLYESADYSHIDLAVYLRAVCTLAIEARPGQPGPISLDLGLEPTQMLFDAALALGLVVLELLSGILGRAIPGGPPPRISLSLRGEPAAGICIRLAGNGMEKAPAEERRDELRTRLIDRTINDQLKGRIEKGQIGNEDESMAGTSVSWIIHLPNNQYSPRIAV